MTTPLFCYGTLEIPEVMAAVTGRRFDAIPARLPDHARYLLHGETYPGILHSYRSEVAGVLYRNVDADSLVLLDRFEGDFYRRSEVRITIGASERVRAQAYIVPPRHEPLLSQRPWERERFVAEHLDEFLAYCRSFHGSQARPPGSAAGGS